MFLSFVLFCLIVQINCVEETQEVELILKYENEPFVDYSKGYSYSFETNNNINVKQMGKVDENGDNLSIRGSYSFVDPEGTLHKVFYVADKNGYRVLPMEVLPMVNKTGIPAKKRISPKVLASLAGGGGLG